MSLNKHFPSYKLQHQNLKVSCLLATAQNQITEPYERHMANIEDLSIPITGTTTLPQLVNSSVHFITAKYLSEEGNTKTYKIYIYFNSKEKVNGIWISYGDGVQWR